MADAQLSVMFDMVDRISSQLASITDQGKALSQSFENTEHTMNSTMNTMEETAESISNSMEETAESFDNAGNSANEFGNHSVGAVNNLNDAIVTAGIAAAVTKIAQAFYDAAQKAELAETAFAKLQTISGEEHISDLSKGLFALSNHTGQSIDELADVAYNAISAGTAVTESVNMAETASKLATAGFTDTSSALGVLSTAMNSYGDSVGSVTHVSDTLITTQNLGVTTVAELATQMGKAISTASAYNVSLENLESSYISVTKAGISTAEGTTYISSMLNELGNAGSDISKLLQSQTGSTFGELMESGKSLADVLSIVYESCNRNSEAMMNMWGSAEAGKAANAIISQGLTVFNENLGTLKNQAGVTEKAYSTMADTTEYAHNKMKNAATNAGVQIGNALNPTLEKLYGLMEKVFNGIGKFAKEHPVIVKAIAALATGLAVFTTGLAAYTAATFAANVVKTAFTVKTVAQTAATTAQTAATVAQTAAQTGLNAAMAANPAFWLVTGIAALTTAFVLFADTAYTTKDAMEKLTYESEKHEEQMKNLKDEYDEAAHTYGVNSEKASELAYRIKELESSYEYAGETVGEFAKRIEETGKAIDNLKETYKENINAVNSTYDGSNLLIGQLKILQNQTTLTDSEFEIMQGIVDKLNGSYEGLGLTLDKMTGKTNLSPTELFDIAKTRKEEQEIKVATEGLLNALGEYDKSKNELEQAENEFNKKRDMYDTYYDYHYGEIPEAGIYHSNEELARMKEKLGNRSQKEIVTDYDVAFNEHKEAQEHYEDLTKQIRLYHEQLGYSKEETDKFIESLIDGSLAVGESTKQLSDAEKEFISYQDAMTKATSSVKENLKELTDDYDKAYNSAMQSMEKQYALWDKVENKSKVSVKNINDSIQSQIDYWSKYNQNLGNLKGRKIDGLSDMLKEMDNGSEKSAAALASMAKASDKEIEKLVKNYKKLKQEQGSTADKMAELATNFNERLKEIEDGMKDTVEKLEMEDKAKNAAYKTISGYIDTIRNMKGEAMSAASAVAYATQEALNKTYVSNTPLTPNVPTPNVPAPNNTHAPKTSFWEKISSKLPKHAKGTMDSEKVYIAGEEGPELIMSNGGDKVFPHEETNRIISAVNDNVHITAPMNTNTINESSNKTITLKIEGSGTIGVKSETSKESIWDNLKDKLKSTFMSVLQEEIYEEGDGVYEF